MKKKGRTKYTISQIRKEAKKYTKRSEFHDKCGQGYKKAKELGILEDVCSHMTSYIWDKKRLQNEALKYSTKTEFSKKSGGAYHSALKKGLLDEICSHMKVQRILWSEKKIFKEAKKYKHRVDFQNGSKNAYAAALRQGLLDEACSHMTPKVKEWTIEEVTKEARKYKYRTEFSKKSGGAYTFAKRRKILDQVCKHMDLLWEKKWDEKSITKEIKKYQFKSEFIKKSRGAYQAALRLGIYRKISKHMKNGKVKWDLKTLKEEAKKYKHRSEFAKKSGGAYKAAQDLGLLDIVCSHMKILYNGYFHCVYLVQNNKDCYVGVTSQRFEERIKQHLKPNNPTMARVIASLPDTEFNQITDYIYTADQVKAGIEKKFVIKYKKMGLNVLNKYKSLGNIGYSKIKWTEKKLTEEARKYTGRYDFQKGSPNAYASALRQGNLEKICRHMIPKLSYWTKGRILHNASLYDSLEEIRIKKSYLHKLIYKKRLVNEAREIIGLSQHKYGSNESKDLWLQADKIYSLWTQSGKCGSWKIAKITGKRSDAMIKRFKNGWIPSKDEDWKDWKKKNSYPQNKSVTVE